MIQTNASPLPAAAKPGAIHSSAPPMSISTPMTICEGKNRSAISPRNSGAIIAAIGAAP